MNCLSILNCAYILSVYVLSTYKFISTHVYWLVKTIRIIEFTLSTVIRALEIQSTKDNPPYKKSIRCYRVLFPYGHDEYT